MDFEVTYTEEQQRFRREVRAWLEEAGFVIEEEGTGKWYQHFLARKR